MNPEIRGDLHENHIGEWMVGSLVGSLRVGAPISIVLVEGVP